QPLGTNPRTCETCHSANQGWTLTTLAATELFFTSQGLAPLFNPVDQGARPDEDLSTFFSRLINFAPNTLALGVTRFTRTNPATSEFNVTAVHDPSGFSTTTSFLNFRRPTSVANESSPPSRGWWSAQPTFMSSVNRRRCRPTRSLPRSRSSSPCSSPRRSTRTPVGSTSTAPWADRPTSWPSRFTSGSTTSRGT